MVKGNDLKKYLLDISIPGLYVLYPDVCMLKIECFYIYKCHLFYLMKEY